MTKISVSATASTPYCLSVCLSVSPMSVNKTVARKRLISVKLWVFVGTMVLLCGM